MWRARLLRPLSPLRSLDLPRLNPGVLQMRTGVYYRGPPEDIPGEIANAPKAHEQEYNQFYHQDVSDWAFPVPYLYKPKGPVVKEHRIFSWANEHVDFWRKYYLSLLEDNSFQFKRFFVAFKKRYLQTIYQETCRLISESESEKSSIAARDLYESAIEFYLATINNLDMLETQLFALEINQSGRPDSWRSELLENTEESEGTSSEEVTHIGFAGNYEKLFGHSSHLKAIRFPVSQIEDYTLPELDFIFREWARLVKMKSEGVELTPEPLVSENEEADDSNLEQKNDSFWNPDPLEEPTDSIRLARPSDFSLTGQQLHAIDLMLDEVLKLDDSESSSDHNINLNSDHVKAGVAYLQSVIDGEKAISDFDCMVTDVREKFGEDAANKLLPIITEISQLTREATSTDDESSEDQSLDYADYSDEDLVSQIPEARRIELRNLLIDMINEGEQLFDGTEEEREDFETSLKDLKFAGDTFGSGDHDYSLTEFYVLIPEITFEEFWKTEVMSDANNLDPEIEKVLKGYQEGVCESIYNMRRIFDILFDISLLDTRYMNSRKRLKAFDVKEDLHRIFQYHRPDFTSIDRAATRVGPHKTYSVLSSRLGVEDFLDSLAHLEGYEFELHKKYREINDFALVMMPRASRHALFERLPIFFDFKMNLEDERIVQGAIDYRIHELNKDPVFLADKLATEKLITKFNEIMKDGFDPDVYYRNRDICVPLISKLFSDSFADAIADPYVSNSFVKCLEFCSMLIRVDCNRLLDYENGRELSIKILDFFLQKVREMAPVAKKVAQDKVWDDIYYYVGGKITRSGRLFDFQNPKDLNVELSDSAIDELEDLELDDFSDLSADTFQGVREFRTIQTILENEKRENREEVINDFLEGYSKYRLESHSMDEKMKRQLKNSLNSHPVWKILDKKSVKQLMNVHLKNKKLVREFMENRPALNFFNDELPPIPGEDYSARLAAAKKIMFKPDQWTDLDRYQIAWAQENEVFVNPETAQLLNLVLYNGNTFIESEVFENSNREASFMVLDSVKESIWAAYNEDPVRNDHWELARRFNLRVDRIDAILRLKHIEKTEYATYEPFTCFQTLDGVIWALDYQKFIELQMAPLEASTDKIGVDFRGKPSKYTQYQPMYTHESTEVPEEGPGSGKLVDSKETRRRLRHPIVVTHLDNIRDTGNVDVFVRDESGRLRYPTMGEFRHAVRNERPLSRKARKKIFKELMDAKKEGRRPNISPSQGLSE